MSSESRVVRPYVGVDRLQKVLDGFCLLVGGDVVPAGEKLKLSPLDFLTRPVSVAIAGDGAPLDDIREQLRTGVDELEIERSDTELLVLLSTDRLKRSEIAWRCTIDALDDLETVVDLPNGSSRPVELQAPFGGCRIDVYLALARRLEPAVLKPWRKGTWLGRVSFHLSTDLGEIGFTPLPLDDDARDKLKVSKDTNRVVQINDSVLEPDVGDDAIELYVDSELLGALAHFPSTAGSRAFQAQLFLDVMSAIVIEAIRSPDLNGLSIEDLEGTLLGKVLARVATRRSGESEAAVRQRQDSLLGQVRNEPLRFLAALEATCKTKGDLSGAFMGAAS